MKIRMIFLLVVFLTGIFSCSMNDDNDDVELSSDTTAISSLINPKRMLVSSDGSPVTFLCDIDNSNSVISYQWYKCENILFEDEVLIENETEASYTTSILSKGIHYYYCKTTTSDFIENKIIFAAAYTGLPLVTISLDSELYEITRDSYVRGTMNIDSEEYGSAQYDLGLKGRGNSSWNMIKKGYNIKFDKKQTPFNLSKSKKWCIVANYSDKTLLRNKFASTLGNDVFNSGWNPTFINVDVVINGEYQGNYTFCEKNTLGKNRIDVTDISDNGVSLDEGGFVLEIDARLDADFYFKSKRGVCFTLKDPDEVSEEIKEYIKQIVQQAEDSLYGENFKDEYSGWQKYLDVDSFVDWYLVNEFAKNVDGKFYLSVYMYYDPNDKKLHLGPNWDFDISFGNANYNDCDNPNKWYIKNAEWISRLFEDEFFVEKVKERWNEKKEALSNSYTTKLTVLSEKNILSADYNFIRWPILGIYVWPNPAGFENRKTYQSEVNYLIDWCYKRYNWMDTAINNL